MAPATMAGSAQCVFHDVKPLCVILFVVPSLRLSPLGRLLVFTVVT